MTRHALALALAIVSIPAPLAAQTRLTIEADSAEVRESPTAAGRVIGLAPRGHVLEVSREQGDWVTVVWPEGTSGVGYVRLTIGSLAMAATKDAARSDVRAEVEAVERRMFAIWADRSPQATAGTGGGEHPR